MYSKPFPRLMSPNVQITRRPASPSRTFWRASRFAGDTRHAVRNDLHAGSRHAVDACQKSRGDFGHDDDPWLWAARIWISRRGSGSGWVISVWNVVTIGLATAAHEIEHALAPFARVEAELVLQAHQVAGAVVGDFRRQRVGIAAAVVDDMDHARVVVMERARLQDRRGRGDRLAAPPGRPHRPNPG